MYVTESSCNNKKKKKQTRHMTLYKGKGLDNSLAKALLTSIRDNNLVSPYCTENWIHGTANKHVTVHNSHITLLKVNDLLKVVFTGQSENRRTRNL